MSAHADPLRAYLATEWPAPATLLEPLRTALAMLLPEHARRIAAALGPGSAVAARMREHAGP